MKNKSNIFFTLSLVLIFTIASINTSHAYTPQQEYVKSYTFSNVTEINEILPGTLVNFSVVINNFTNNTINNITLVQHYAEGFFSDLVDLVESPVGVYNGDPINYTSDVKLYEITSKQFKSVNYLNITNSNFTMNIDTIESGHSFGFTYVLNFTEEFLYAPENTEIAYYDHWGDKKTIEGELTPNFEILGLEEDPTKQFFPSIDSLSTLNASIIFLTFGLLGLIILLVRVVVYFKNPFKI